MMVVVVETQPGFKADTPRVLFEGRYSSYGLGLNYGVSPDGQGFLMMQAAEHSRLSLNIVQNWHQGCRYPSHVIRPRYHARPLRGHRQDRRRRHED